nr:MAG TPA: hypothetical protein [Caudoviricetes sp.]
MRHLILVRFISQKQMNIWQQKKKYLNLLTNWLKKKDILITKYGL